MSNLALKAPQTEQSTHRHGHALRFIDTKKLKHTDWLTISKQGIGSSDAAAAIGLNPYQSALELWMHKTNRDVLLPVPNSNDDTQAAYWGTLLEPIVAQAYTKRTGNKVRKVNAVLLHPNYPWMLANLDRTIIGNEEVQILECQTAGIHGSRSWKNGVPEYVQIQVMHQLAVTSYQAADITILLARQALQIHRIERNEP